jgi:hypothetical protein
MDGGYPLFINQFKEQSINAGYDFKDINFLFPARKEIDKELTVNELHYNKVFGSYRSTIENEFSILGSKFERFNNNRSPVQTSDIKYYNLQFKTVCLLKNIWNMIQNHNVDEFPHHKLWHSDNFEFPIIESKLNIAFNDELTIDKNYKEMNELQDKLLNMNLEDIDNYDPDFEDENNDMETNELPRKKNRKGKQKEVVTYVNIKPKYQFPK